MYLDKARVSLCRAIVKQKDKKRIRDIAQIWFYEKKEIIFLFKKGESIHFFELSRLKYTGNNFKEG